MKRNTALIVSGLLICCMNAPFTAYAAAYAEAGSRAAVSSYADRKHLKKKFKIDVDALVKDNVINKETGEKVKLYIKEHSREHKAEREKVRGMTDEERKAYFKAKYPHGKPDIWSEMAAAGVITPEEADAIKASMRARHEKDK